MTWIVPHFCFSTLCGITTFELLQNCSKQFQNCFEQAGVWSRLLDQSCVFWRIILLKKKSSWNCPDVSGRRSICLPTFFFFFSNLFRPDNHLVCGQLRWASSKQLLEIVAEPRMSSLPIVCHTQAGSIWRHLGKQEAGDQSCILPIRLHFDVRAFRERPYPLSILQLDLPEVLWYSGPRKIGVQCRSKPSGHGSVSQGSKHFLNFKIFFLNFASSTFHWKNSNDPLYYAHFSLILTILMFPIRFIFIILDDLWSLWSCCCVYLFYLCVFITAGCKSNCLSGIIKIPWT